MLMTSPTKKFRLLFWVVIDKTWISNSQETDLVLGTGSGSPGTAGIPEEAELGLEASIPGIQTLVQLAFSHITGTDRTVCSLIGG